MTEIPGWLSTEIRTHVVSLGSIEDTSAEEVRLMVALEFDDEQSSVLTTTSQIKPDALIEQGKTGNLRGLVRNVLHFPVRWKDDIEDVNEHVIVPLVTEYGLQAGICKNIHIPLHYGASAVWSSAVSSFLMHKIYI